MKSDGFNGNINAREFWGGALHGLRYVPSPTYDAFMGKPSPTAFHSERGYALAHRTPDNQGVLASKWHETMTPVLAAGRHIAAKCDRRQRRGRVAKKLARRGGRRRFAAPAYVRRLNAKS